MASGTSSTATLFTLPSCTSRSYQIIEPQLNRGSIRSPDQRSFVWIYFKKMRGYHVSNVKGVTPALARSARVARAVYVCPIAKHPERKQSPGNTQPAISRIPPPHTKRHHLFKTLTWTPSNQNGIVPRIFFKCTRFNLSHLALIFPHKNGQKHYSYRVSNAFFYEGILFEPRFQCPFQERKPIRTSFPRAHSSRQVYCPPPSTISNLELETWNLELSPRLSTFDLRPLRQFGPLQPLGPLRPHRPLSQSTNDRISLPNYPTIQLPTWSPHAPRLPRPPKRLPA